VTSLCCGLFASCVFWLTLWFATFPVIKNLCPHSNLAAEYIGEIESVISSLHHLVLSDVPSVYEHAIGALCSLTTECVKNRVVRVEDVQLSLSIQLATKACHCIAKEDNEVLQMYGAGLICNMAASDGYKDTTTKIGQVSHLHEHLVACLSSTSDAVRVNALSALCNLARTNMNKVHIGKVSGCLERLNRFLESGTEAEKAQASILMFYLGFTFKNNAAFGALPGSLDRIVELLRTGNDEQIENAAAALSILACNAGNASQLTSEEKRAGLLQTLVSTLKNGNSMQRMNSVVCLWNLSASSEVTKSDIGKLPSIFIYLVDILKQDRTSEVAQQTVGLLAELMYKDDRNAILFGKVARSVEMLLEMSFETKQSSVVEISACWAVTNFAANDDERLRKVAEMEGGLSALSRLVARGDKQQQEYACKLLASDVLKSQAGRKKIVRVPGLLSSLVTVCTNLTDTRRRYSVEVLHNLAAGPR
jgi:hypothetical protein